MKNPTRSEIAQRAMRGEPLGIRVWVRRRGADKAAAILHQWAFTVDEPNQELTITLDHSGVPIAPRKRDMSRENEPPIGMSPADFAQEHKNLTGQLELHKFNARQTKKAAKAYRKQTLIENTKLLKHRIDVGWTLLVSIAITAFSVLAMFGKLPFGW